MFQSQSSARLALLTRMISTPSCCVLSCRLVHTTAAVEGSRSHVHGSVEKMVRVNHAGERAAVMVRAGKALMKRRSRPKVDVLKVKIHTAVSHASLSSLLNHEDS